MKIILFKKASEMKTLHQQQDSHHNSEMKNKNILSPYQNEKNVEHYNKSLTSFFSPFHHYAMNDHVLNPFFKMEKHISKNEEYIEPKTNEITKSILEAYNKQIGLSLDSTQKIHKEFVDQITNLYNLNQQFWNTFLFSYK